MMPTRFGIEMPFGGARSNEADGALDVFQFDGVMIFGAEAVFENEAVDADGVEPLGDGFSFVGGEMHVGAAGANDECGAGGGTLRGEEGSQRRDIGIIGALGSGGVLLPESDGGFGGGGWGFVAGGG